MATSVEPKEFSKPLDAFETLKQNYAKESEVSIAENGQSVTFQVSHKHKNSKKKYATQPYLEICKRIIQTRRSDAAQPMEKILKIWCFSGKF